LSDNVFILIYKTDKHSILDLHLWCTVCYRHNTCYSICEIHSLFVNCSLLRATSHLII